MNARLVNLQKLQHPPKVHILATEGTEKDEKITDIIACSPKKTGQALQIANLVWPESIPHYQTITLAGDMAFRVGKKKTRDKITMEEWSFANMRIMQKLLKQKTLINVNAFLNYTTNIFKM